MNLERFWSSVETVSLRGKTLFIAGASRGIGLALGLRAARDGANAQLLPDYFI
jgi:citronellol/citronellal dehydrogenase